MSLTLSSPLSRACGPTTAPPLATIELEPDPALFLSPFTPIPGYVLSDQIVQRAIETDQKQGISCDLLSVTIST